MELGRLFECNERTIARIWKRFKASVAAGNAAGDTASRIKGNATVAASRIKGNATVAASALSRRRRFLQQWTDQGNLSFFIFLDMDLPNNCVPFFAGTTHIEKLSLMAKLEFGLLQWTQLPNAQV